MDEEDGAVLWRGLAEVAHWQRGHCVPHLPQEIDTMMLHVECCQLGCCFGDKGMNEM
jgi:hypothetical protein